MTAMLLGLSSLLSVLSAQAAPPSAPLKRDRDFVSACILAFDRSSGNGSLGVGRQICECTADENRHQGATARAIERETARIKADPTAKIRDQHVLDALHYCSLEILRGDG